MSAVHQLSRSALRLQKHSLLSNGMTDMFNASNANVISRKSHRVIFESLRNVKMNELVVMMALNPYISNRLIHKNGFCLAKTRKFATAG